jgi:hypothetical protein
MVRNNMKAKNRFNVHPQPCAQLAAELNYTRLEWNAIIEQLIESSGKDAQARLAIASLGARLRPMKGIRMDASITHNADHISGATPEHGNIEIDPGGTEEKSIRIGYGTEERIGYYKIARSRRKRLFFFPYEDLILIRHHWKSDLTTMSETEPPKAWGLCCNTKMVPVWFGEVVYTRSQFGKFSIMFSEIKELWGPKPGTLHYLNAAISLDSSG